MIVAFIYWSYISTTLTYTDCLNSSWILFQLVRCDLLCCICVPNMYWRPFSNLPCHYF